MSETPHVPQVHDLLPGQASSVPRMLLDRIATTPDREAYRYPVGEDWRSMTWKQSYERVKAIAAGADILVVGRPITGAPDPLAAARAVVEEIARA